MFLLYNFLYHPWRNHFGKHEISVTFKSPDNIVKMPNLNKKATTSCEAWSLKAFISPLDHRVFYSQNHDKTKSIVEKRIKIHVETTERERERVKREWGGKLRQSRCVMRGSQNKQCHMQTCSHSLPLSFLETVVFFFWLRVRADMHRLECKYHFCVPSQGTLFLNAKEKSISISLCPDYRSRSPKLFFIQLFLFVLLFSNYNSKKYFHLI